MATGNQLQNALTDAEKTHAAAVESLAAAQANYTKLKNSNTATPTEIINASNAINRTSFTVKSTQLNLNTTQNNLQASQGKTGNSVSPAIDSNAKQTPFVVPTSPQGNGDLLNNPNGLILGAAALTAITKNPNLISSIGSGIGKFFNNASDILPVSTNVPKSSAAVDPTTTPSQNVDPFVPPTDTASTVPLTNEEIQQQLDAADLRIASESATAPAGDDALAAFDAAQQADLNARLDRAGDIPLTDEDAAIAAQDALDLRIASESATAPLTAQDQQEQTQLLAGITDTPTPVSDAAFAAAQDAELNARLDRAGDVPLTDEDAALLAQETADLQIAAESATPVDPVTEGLLLEQEQLRQFQADEELNARLDRAADVDLANSGDAATEAAAREKEAADLRIASESATPVDGPTISALDANEFGAQNVAGEADTAESNAASQAAVGTGLAQKQAVLAAQKKMANNGDWRVRLSLAPGATYLYNASPPGILQPLAATDGVVFPYMPKIDTNYKAEYDTYNLTHSNYRGYFYKGSYTDAVNLTATFTAQDSSEADYLLAVIHFFKSITKMFYGQDPERGAPPPLVYLTGLGEYQFSAHPCVVNNFQLNLPNDVDYIRARSVNINGANLLTRRNKQDLPTNPVSGAVQRLQNLFSSQKINKGAIDSRPAPPTLGLNQPTYVPTKMDISLTLYPIQSRQQVSRQFSLKGYANGDLLKGGFW